MCLVMCGGSGGGLLPLLLDDLKINLKEHLQPGALCKLHKEQLWENTYFCAATLCKATGQRQLLLRMWISWIKLSLIGVSWISQFFKTSVVLVLRATWIRPTQENVQSMQTRLEEELNPLAASLFLALIIRREF